MSTNISTVYTYQLNGVTVDFKIPFDYLSRKFVKVTLLGKDRKVLNFMTDYRFMSPTVIRTVKAWGPSDDYNYIEIRRETSARDLIVDFSDGSILRAGDLNTANLQAMHIAEEARSLAADSLGVNDEGNLDARFRKIVNLGDPVGRKDAVNKGYIDDAKDSVTDSRDKAKQYRNEAEAFKNQTETLKNQTNTIKSQAISETTAIRNQSQQYAINSNSYANESKAQIAKAQAVLEDVRDEGVIANGYAQATIEHAKASAENAKVAQLNATASQENKVACAGHEAATAVYEQRAREVESTVVAAKNTAEQKAKEANVSASKSNESKVLAEKAKAAAQASASQTNQYKDSAAGSAAAAARDAAAAAQSANNAISQAGAAQASATQAKTAEANAKKYSESINPSTLMPKEGGTFTGDVSHNKSIMIKGQNSPIHATVKILNNERGFYFFNGKFRNFVPFTKEGTLALKEDVMPKTGGTFTGRINLEGLDAKIYLNNSNTPDNTEWRIVPLSTNGSLGFWYNGTTSGSGWVSIPKKAGTLALTSDIKKKTWAVPKGITGIGTNSVTFNLEYTDSDKFPLVRVRTASDMVTSASRLAPSQDFIIYERGGYTWNMKRLDSSRIQISKSGGQPIENVIIYGEH